MAAVSFRNLDDDVQERLRVRAVCPGRALAAEIRAILEESVRPPEGHHLGRAFLAPGEGWEL